ncbi:MAG: hypothetical protein ACFE96_14785, partial [Candidatus Hermodarchaeota archaeon]
MSLDKITVCFTSKVSEGVQNYLMENLKEVSNIELIFPKDTSEENLMNIIPKAQVLIGWRPSKSILDKAINLKVFINPGAGINHLLELFKQINKDRKVLLINGHGN